MFARTLSFDEPEEMPQATDVVLHIATNRQLFHIARHEENRAEEQRLIQVMDQIRAAIAGQEHLMDKLDVPCIVVIGDQSAGKSSFIRALTGVPLHTAMGRCTNRPVEIRMMNACEEQKSEVDSVDVIIRANTRILGFPTDGELRDDAEALRLLQAVLLQLNQATRGFSSDPVIMEVRMHQSIALTIVDLPGMTATNESARLVPIYQQFIQRPNAIVVAVISANTNDMETNYTFQRFLFGASEECAQLRQRTIGVITMLDTIQASESLKEQWYHRLMPSNDFASYSLPHGYYIVKCHGADDDRPQATRFGTPEELEDYHTAPWIRECCTLGISDDPSVIEERFGRSNIRTVLKQRLVVLSQRALRIFPTIIQTALQRLETERLLYPTASELANRKKVLSAQFRDEIRRCAAEIRPLRGLDGTFGSVPSIVGNKTCRELIKGWDDDLWSALNAVNSFPQAADLRHRSGVHEFATLFENMIATDRRCNLTYQPESPEELDRIASAAAAMANPTEEELALASRSALAVYLSRYDDGLVGFLEVGVFRSLVEFVLRQVMTVAMIYFRRVASLCWYIADVKVWQSPNNLNVHLYNRLIARLKIRVRASFETKLNYLVQQATDTLRTVASCDMRRNNHRETFFERAFVHSKDKTAEDDSVIKRKVIEAVTKIWDETKESTTIDPDAIGQEQVNAITKIFEQVATERSLEPHQRDAWTYLQMVKAYWEDKKPEIYTQLTQAVDRCFFAPDNLSLMGELRQLSWSDEDIDLIDDDLEHILPKINAIERQRAALRRAAEIISTNYK